MKHIDVSGTGELYQTAIQVNEGLEKWGVYYLSWKSMNFQG